MQFYITLSKALEGVFALSSNNKIMFDAINPSVLMHHHLVIDQTARIEGKSPFLVLHRLSSVEEGS